MRVLLPVAWIAVAFLRGAISSHGTAAWIVYILQLLLTAAVGALIVYEAVDLIRRRLEARARGEHFVTQGAVRLLLVAGWLGTLTYQLVSAKGSEIVGMAFGVLTVALPAFLVWEWARKRRQAA
jgi:hypothetical protein